MGNSIRKYKKSKKDNTKFFKDLPEFEANPIDVSSVRFLLYSSHEVCQGN